MQCGSMAGLCHWKEEYSCTSNHKIKSAQKRQSPLIPTRLVLLSLLLYIYTVLLCGPVIYIFFRVAYFLCFTVCSAIVIDNVAYSFVRSNSQPEAVKSNPLWGWLANKLNSVFENPISRLRPNFPTGTTKRRRHC